jgi:hypothetical protein
VQVQAQVGMRVLVRVPPAARARLP